MILDLTTIAPGLSIACCGLLLVVWLLCSRRLRGFVYCIAGWLMIYAALHSDGKPRTLLGIALVGLVLTTIVLTTFGVLAARRRAARSRGPVYVPTQRK